jgi:hypothetical protein
MGQVGAWVLRTRVCPKLLRWNWSLEKSIATGTHNNEPLDHLEWRLAAPAVKRSHHGQAQARRNP